MNMVSYTTRANLLKVLSHPTRLAVLEILRDGEQCVCHMEAVLELRQASLSQQLMVLREAGLVKVRRDGLNVFYRVARPKVLDLLDALSEAGGRAKTIPVRMAGRAGCPCPKCYTASGGTKQGRRGS